MYGLIPLLRLGPKSVAHIKHDEDRERDVGRDKGCGVPVTREEDRETVSDADEAHHQ